MTNPPADRAPELPARRNFLIQAVTFVLSSLLALAPLVAGLAFFADPLLRRRSTMRGATADGYLPVAKVGDLPDDGTPVRFSLQADKVDAWNLFRSQTVGTVYLRKIAGQVLAFNDVCPHLGCKIDYKPAEGAFFCPCHASRFNLDGERQNDIPPRDMDRLEWREEDGVVWVKYVNYQRGKAEKVPV
uniref:Rieske (2Fe-2S) protein n=1 Tax=Schlesneria paludicola TaxID=360056 RepID=A0A7C4LND8_9PLAN